MLGNSTSECHTCSSNCALFRAVLFLLNRGHYWIACARRLRKDNEGDDAILDIRASENGTVVMTRAHWSLHGFKKRKRKKKKDDTGMVTTPHRTCSLSYLRLHAIRTLSTAPVDASAPGSSATLPRTLSGPCSGRWAVEHSLSSLVAVDDAATSNTNTLTTRKSAPAFPSPVFTNFCVRLLAVLRTTSMHTHLCFGKTGVPC